MHHTKDKGDLGVLKAQVDLCLQGYVIMIPLTEHAPFDIVVYKDGIFKKIQVKYRSISKNGVLEVAFKSYWSNKSGVNCKKQDKNEIDVCCIYCPETNKCYYVDIKEFKDIYISLRIKKPKIPSSKCNMADDYLVMPT